MSHFNHFAAPWGGLGGEAAPSILDRVTSDLHALCEEAWGRDVQANPRSASASSGENPLVCSSSALGGSSSNPCFASASNFSTASSFGAFGLGSNSSACCGASDDGSGSSIQSESSGGAFGAGLSASAIPSSMGRYSQEASQASPTPSATPQTSPQGAIIATLPTQLQPVQFVSLEYLRLLAKAPTPVTRVNFVQRPPGVPAQLLRAGSNGAAVSIIGGVPVTIRGSSGNRGGSLPSNAGNATYGGYHHQQHRPRRSPPNQSN